MKRFLIIVSLLGGLLTAPMVAGMLYTEFLQPKPVPSKPLTAPVMEKKPAAQGTPAVPNVPIYSPPVIDLCAKYDCNNPYKYSVPLDAGSPSASPTIEPYQFQQPEPYQSESPEVKWQDDKDDCHIATCD